MKLIAKLLGLDEAATEEQILDALKSKLAASDTAEIAKALELKDDASGEEIVAAIKAKDDDGTEVTAEERAEAEGKVVFTKSDAADLKRMASAGQKAADELHQSKFDTAFEKALDGVRVDAKDETRERWQKLYDADADTALEALDNLPKLASSTPRGSGGGVEDDDADDRTKLDRKAKAYAKEHKVSYEDALDAVLEDED